MKTWPIKGLLLNGGRSTRMGKDKGSLQLGRSTLQEHMLAMIRQAGVESIHISGSEIKDRYQNQGPLAGVEAVLSRFPNSCWLVLPVDMPLLNSELLRQLISFGQRHNSNVHFTNSVMPLFIADGDDSLVSIRACLESPYHRNWSFRHWLSGTSVNTISVADDFRLSNINTPEQWADFQHRETGC